MIAAVASVEEAREVVLGADRLLPVGAGTKPALSRCAESGVVGLDLSGLTGITSYDPAELTISARAGTPIAELEAELGVHGQQLPFDPILGDAGATIGGTVAAGVSGPGALGHGLVRDFVIGITVLDGAGRRITGGGRVVKNAAGFDLPKLMVGSAGRLGVIAEVCCKVFPRAEAQASAIFECDTAGEALRTAAALSRGPVALEALDIDPPGRLQARIGGDRAYLDARLRRLQDAAGAPSELPTDGASLWRAATELTWVPAGATVVAVGVSGADLARLEPELASLEVSRRHCLGAGLTLLAWPAGRDLDQLSRLLEGLGLGAIVLVGGPAPLPLIGATPGAALGRRVRAALDPERRFLELWP